MTKIHTRVKRRNSLTTSKNQYGFFHNLTRKKRPKTFTTETTAHEWAAENKLKKETYSLKKVKKGLRFQIVMDEKQ